MTAQLILSFLLTFDFAQNSLIFFLFSNKLKLKKLKLKVRRNKGPSLYKKKKKEKIEREKVSRMAIFEDRRLPHAPLKSRSLSW